MARATTPRLNLGMWDDGDNPGAGSKTEIVGNTGLNGNWLRIDLAIGTEHNADGTHKTGVIRAENLNDDVVDGITIIRDAITKKLKIGNIPGVHLQDLSVTTNKIVDGAVTRSKIENGAIDGTKLDKENLGLYYQELAIFSFLDNDSIQVSALFNGIRCDNFWGYVFYSDIAEEVKVMAQARFKISPRIIETAETLTTLSPGDVIWVYRDSDDLIVVARNNSTLLQLTRPVPVFTGRGLVIVAIRRKVRGWR
jgi:hypothetical protein